MCVASEESGVKRGRLITGRIPGVDKPVSKVIYGTLFLHSFESDEKCFELLDGVWGAVVLRGSATRCSPRGAPAGVYRTCDGGEDGPGAVEILYH